MKLRRLVATLCFLSILSCSSLSKKAPKPETCEPDFRNNAFQCVLSDESKITRPFNVTIDNDYSLIHTKQLGNYMGTCR